MCLGKYKGSQYNSCSTHYSPGGVQCLRMRGAEIGMAPGVCATSNVHPVADFPLFSFEPPYEVRAEGGT